MIVKVITHATIYTGKNVLEDAYIRFDSQIKEVGTMTNFKANQDEEVIDASDKMIIPGFIDVHSHGGYGHDAMDADPKALKEQVRGMLKEGITTYFPTTMTQSHENIENALKVIAEVAKNEPIIGGIHLEGPFVSAIFKGAQPEKYIQAPDLDLFKKWFDVSGGLIKVVTYAPEHETSPAFEDLCYELGVVPSVGHSNDTREHLKTSKATHATHLYNACHRMTHREPGVPGHVLLEDGIQAELICDGIHVNRDMVKLAYKMKGAHGISLITDSMRAKGMPEGKSELGGQTVIVKDKQARLEDGTLAGSVLTYDDAFRNIIEFTGCTIEEAVLMSSVNQATEFQLSQKGALQAGKDADFNIFDTDLNLLETYSYGRKYS
ncbi:N-acetylglucosamine-6-phosphate deacetylase [Listeria sp. PSOL-1]|uniref:N-acetylglucosamine-6-phosphate deacetylase n=1 Tax=Listeria sp. PSOL-1 TaxID=1844999 RepID=UPI0013D5D34E|nr:N-acetylglucosamine-6-phosphate deacetylase [Listeria sp. PSOL-1]